MKLEVLMSVMHQTDFDIAYKSKVDSDLLIINQCDKDDYAEIVVNGHLWRMISTTERGLSKSRNMAIRNATGDICLFSDDDEAFEDGYAQKIINAYNDMPDATAIAFNVHRINYSMKKTYYQIPSFRVAPSYRGYQSGMLSFKRDIICEHNILMDERFGSGTQWGGGEEILFERDIRRCGLKLYENPSFIATLDYGGGSQWFKGYDEKYFYNIGAFNNNCNDGNVNCKLLAYLFYMCFIKLRKENKLSSIKKMQWIIRGWNGFKKGIPYSQYINQ